MAISINQQPTTWIIAGNSVKYRVGGDQYLLSGQARPDYRIVCKLYRIDVIAGVPQAAVLVGELVGIPSVAQTFVASSVTYYYVDFDLSGLILADLPTPHFSASIGRSTSNLLRNYKADFNEYYNNTSFSTTISNTCAAIPAGRPIIRNYDLASVIAQHLTPGAGQRFLNNVSGNYIGRILYNEPLTLNFYNSYNSGFVNLKATVYYLDGSNQVARTFFIYAGANPGINFIQFQILLSQVSWNVLITDPFFGVTLSEAFDVENIFRISFVVTNVDVEKSETVTYNVIHSSRFRFGRAYYYANSLGFMECLPTTGARIAKKKLQVSDAEVTANNDSAASTKIVDGNLAQYNQLLTQEFTQHVGYTSKELYDAFNDFVRSPIKLVKEGAYYYPIVLSKLEFDGNSDDQAIFPQSFTYKYASLEGFTL